MWRVPVLCCVLLCCVESCCAVWCVVCLSLIHISEPTRPSMKKSSPTLSGGRSSHEAKTLLGTPPEQRHRSIPSGIRADQASGWLRFPPLWETSVWRVPVLCCVVLSCALLRCSVWCGVCVLFLCSRSRCAIQNENPISESIGNRREIPKGLGRYLQEGSSGAAAPWKRFTGCPSVPDSRFRPHHASHSFGGQPHMG